MEDFKFLHGKKESENLSRNIIMDGHAGFIQLHPVNYDSVEHRENTPPMSSNDENDVVFL